MSVFVKSSNMDEGSCCGCMGLKSFDSLFVFVEEFKFGCVDLRWLDCLFVFVEEFKFECLR